MKCSEIFVKSALSRSRLENTEYSLNPYRGCGHSCVYCYAPYVLHVPREEWNSNILAKVNLPTVLDREMKRKRPRGTITVGTVTDAYQPCERRYGITRRSLEVLLKYDARVSILTKSSLVLRDSDLLGRFRHVEVGVTITSTDDSFRRKVEPRASSVEERFRVLDELPGSVLKYVFVGPLFSEEYLDVDYLFRRAKKAGVAYIIVDRFREKEGMVLPGWFRSNLGDVRASIKRFREMESRYGIPVVFAF